MVYPPKLGPVRRAHLQHVGAGTDGGSHPRHSQRIPPCVFVALGGGLGALARGGLDACASAHPWNIPLLSFLPLSWSTVLVDLLGAFFLGALSALLARTVAPTRRDVNLRLFAASGFAGAFTTYGTLIAATYSGMVATPGFGVLACAAASLLVLILGVAAAGAGWLLLRSARARRASKWAEL